MRQLVAFSYWNWLHNDSDASNIKDEVTHLTHELFRWLETEPPDVPDFDFRNRSHLDALEWFKSGQIISPQDDARSASVRCLIDGPTVSLVMMSMLEPPSEGVTPHAIMGAHANSVRTPPLGSHVMVGARIDEALPKEPADRQALGSQLLGAANDLSWIEWQGASQPDQVLVASAQTTDEKNHGLHVLVGNGPSAQNDAARLANVLIANATRYLDRSNGMFEVQYRQNLQPTLSSSADRLERYSVPAGNLDSLDEQLSELAEETAAYAKAASQLQILTHTSAVDRHNMENLVAKNGLSGIDWFDRGSRRVVHNSDQMTSDADYANIELSQAQSLLSSLNTRASVLRAKIEQTENEISKRRNVLLATFGFLIGLTSMIDRKTGGEFISWINLVFGAELSLEGLVLFLARVLLIVLLTIVGAFAVWPLFKRIRSAYEGSRDPK